MIILYKMNKQELKEYIYDFLETEWCSSYDGVGYTEDDIDEFTYYWTNSKNEEIYNGIENELNMDNIWDIIRYVEFEYDNLCGEPFSFNCKHKLLTHFIYFVGDGFGVDKRANLESDEESDEEEAPS
jgi:hypothetical protein